MNKLKTFEVEVIRIAYRCARVRVQAKHMQEAENNALVLALNHDFNKETEYPADYEVQGITDLSRRCAECGTYLKLGSCPNSKCPAYNKVPKGDGT